MAQQDGRSPHTFYSSAEFFLMPKDKYTFRYGSEDRSQGTIKVKIRVNNYEGPVKAVLACVNAEDKKPMPHPNKVMCPKSRKMCKDGVCMIQKHITVQNNIIEFNQIGIQRVLKRDLVPALRIRTSNTDYPYARGYDEDSRDIRKIDLTRVRFACQVLTLDAAGELCYPLTPVVSSPITHYPEKLRIIDASHDRGEATGGLRVFLFTAKLPKSVVVVFRKTDSEWQAHGRAIQQHKKVALQFTTPPYEDPYDCLEPVKVYYFMATDNTDEQDNKENRRDFTYLPITDKDVRKRVVKKPLNELATTISGRVKSGDHDVAVGGGGGSGSGGSGGGDGSGEAAVELVELMEIPRSQLYNIPFELESISTDFSMADILEPEYEDRPILDFVAPQHAQYEDRPISDIVEPQHAQYEDRPISPDRVEFLNLYGPQAEEVDRIARNYLEQKLSIEKSLLDQYMDVDVAGSENLPG